MILAANIHPLTDFQKNAKSHLRRLRQSGEPSLLTLNGKAAVVVQDASAYERLLRELAVAKEAALLRDRINDSGPDLSVADAMTQLREKVSRFAASATGRAPKAGRSKAA